MASMLKDSRLAIIGREDVVAGFSALGFQVFHRQPGDDIATLLDEIARSGAIACLIQDDIYQGQQETVNNYKNLVLPVFIPFSASGRRELLDNLVREIRLKATGAL